MLLLIWFSPLDWLRARSLASPFEKCPGQSYVHACFCPWWQRHLFHIWAWPNHLKRGRLTSAQVGKLVFQIHSVFVLCCDPGLSLFPLKTKDSTSRGLPHHSKSFNCVCTRQSATVTHDEQSNDSYRGRVVVHGDDAGRNIPTCRKHNSFCITFRCVCVIFNEDCIDICD